MTGGRALPLAIGVVAAIAVASFSAPFGKTGVVAAAALALMPPLALVALSRPHWLAAVATWYLALVALDVSVLGVPLKFLITLLAIGAWLFTRRGPAPRWSVAVVVAALTVPLIWLSIGTILSDSPHLPPDYGIQLAFRFPYLLLYFPLRELMARRPAEEAWRDWAAPVLVLAGATAVLWPLLQEGVISVPPTQNTILTGEGIIGFQPNGIYRLFVGNQILFAPAVAAISARIMCAPRSSWRLFAALALLLVATWCSQTRGIWLGVGIAMGVVTVLSLVSMRTFGARRLAMAAAIAMLLVSPVGIDAVTRVVESLTSRSDLSVEVRYEQAPQLIQEFEDSPIVGKGLSATVPTTDLRWLVAPDSCPRSAVSKSDLCRHWSIELTYHQMLFQMGVLGIGLFFLPFLLAFERVTTRFSRLDLAGRQHAIAFAGGTLGFLATAGTNPYLIAGIGMVGLAAMLATADYALGTHRRADPG